MREGRFARQYNLGPRLVPGPFNVLVASGRLWPRKPYSVTRGVTQGRGLQGYPYIFNYLEANARSAAASWSSTETSRSLVISSRRSS